MDPLETASQPSDPHPAVSDKYAVRGRWLVFVSLILVILIEVLPTEADLLFVAWRHKDMSSFLTTKAICLAIILAPLLLYIWINGWRGVVAVKGRFVAITVIVVLKLVFDIWCIVDIFFR
jgi:hypothetical protein